MGLDIRTVQYLLHCKKEGVSFDSTLTLGRQSVNLDAAEGRAVERKTGLRLEEGGFADAFFKYLGAEEYDSMDASTYENASIVHNLNEPVPESLWRRYSCVIDGGTLEHVFDFPRAYASCMQMVRLNGHLIICNIANNMMGHGFYQFSPELFWSSLTEENGFKVRHVLLNHAGDWYEVDNPAVIGGRAEAMTRLPTYIYVVAQRISEAPPFLRPPHQSDYVNIGVRTSANAGGLKNFLLERSPFLKEAVKRWRKHRSLRNLSLSRQKCFHKIDGGLS